MQYIIAIIKSIISVTKKVCCIISATFRNNECRSRIKIFIEIITLIIGILILKTYYHANQLTQKALELNQKQLMNVHVPWLVIHDVFFDDVNHRVSYFVKNYSSSPALQVKAWLLFVDKSNLTDNKSADFEYKAHIIPPQSEQPDHYRMSPDNYKYAHSAFFTDKLTIQITAEYEDVFARKFTVISSYQVSKDGKNTVIPLAATFTGIEQLK